MRPIFIIGGNEFKIIIRGFIRHKQNPSEITKHKREAYLRNFEKLEILNPLLTLKRGYSITKSNDKIVSSAKDVKSGDELDIEFDDGTVNTKVI